MLIDTATTEETTMTETHQEPTAYTWRTDAAHSTLTAASIEEAVAQLIAAHEWAPIDSPQERRDIADGAWLLITSATEEYQRGIVP